MTMLKKFTYPTIFMFIFCFALPMNAPTKESQTLRLALLPIPDVLPVYVAIRSGTENLDKPLSGISATTKAH